MKTARILLAVSVACTLATASVMAQGRIAFANNSLTPIRISNDGINGGVPVILGTASTALFGFGPASMEIRLYAGLTSTSLSPVLIGTAANQPFVLNTTSGIASAQGTFAGGGNLPLAGFDGTAPVFLQFQAQGPQPAYWYGYLSPIIQVTLATGATPSTSVFSPTADGSHWSGPLISLPEPSVLALVGMSFPLMFLARRRR